MQNLSLGIYRAIIETVSPLLAVGLSGYMFVVQQREKRQRINVRLLFRMEQLDLETRKRETVVSFQASNLGTVAVHLSALDYQVKGDGKYRWAMLVGKEVRDYFPRGTYTLEPGKQLSIPMDESQFSEFVGYSEKTPKTVRIQFRDEVGRHFVSPWVSYDLKAKPLPARQHITNWALRSIKPLASRLHKSPQGSAGTP